MTWVIATGSRADWGKLRPLVRAIDADASGDMAVVILGAHHDPARGETAREVAEDVRALGYPEWRIYNRPGGSDSMGALHARAAEAVSDVLRDLTPGWLVVHGDRPEALGAACAGAFSPGWRVMHVEGGEVSGSTDEGVRHAIAKLSHAHLVSCDWARDTLLLMGEEADRIFVTGDPGLDELAGDLPPLDDVIEHYRLPQHSPLGLLLWHPVSSEPPEEQRRTTRALLDCLHETIEDQGSAAPSKPRLQWVAPWPNADTGAQEVLDEMRKAEWLTLVPSMRRSYFATLLKEAACVVGNSSVVTREAPFFGTPSMLIGVRQIGRGGPPWMKRSLDVPYPDEVMALMERGGAFEIRRYDPHHEFGDGHAADRFRVLLREGVFDRLPVQKRWPVGKGDE